MSKSSETKTEQQRVVAIAIDGSENAKYAYQSPYMFDHQVVRKILEDEKTKLKQKLEEFAMLLQTSGINGTVKSIHAESPGQGLCKVAKEIGASIVVIGSRGLGKIRRTLMGSVSDYVLHHSHVPVIICP